MLSKWALLLAYIILLYTGIFFYPKWSKTGSEATISWDVSGYYHYLPALFIYHDIRECKFQNQIGEKYGPTPYFEPVRLYNHTSGRIMQYNCGLAIAMSPHFLLAHLYTNLFQNYPSDGYSYPYQLALGLGMMLYVLIGLYYLRKILLHYFEDKIVAIVLLFLVSSTCLLNYLAIDQAQANPFLFTCYCILIYSSILYYQSPSFMRAIVLSIFCGFMTLVRPTDIICLLIPMLWGVASASDMQNRFHFWKHRKKWLVAAAFSFFIFPSLQFIYWKYVLNVWFAYSYRDQGFSWLHPHFYSFFLSFKSGFLAYSPAMFLAYLGIYTYIKSKKSLWAVLLVLFISHYITISWDVIDYGWYSGRAMIQYFTFLAFPLASLIDNLMRYRYRVILFTVFWIGALYFNIWWTYHIHYGQIPAMGLSNVQYWSKIGRWW